MSAQITLHAERCIDCRACEVACQRVHGGPSNVTVVRVDGRFAVPIQCRACDPAPCEAACPATALARCDGHVVLHAERCTGCGLCVVACPFGALGWAGGGRLVHLCDLCAERRADGLAPACALTCPTEALAYEEVEAYGGRSRRWAAARMLRSLPPEGRRLAP